MVFIKPGSRPNSTTGLSTYYKMTWSAYQRHPQTQLTASGETLLWLGPVGASASGKWFKALSSLARAESSFSCSLSSSSSSLAPNNCPMSPANRRLADWLPVVTQELPAGLTCRKLRMKRQMRSGCNLYHSMRPEET